MSPLAGFRVGRLKVPDKKKQEKARATMKKATPLLTEATVVNTFGTIRPPLSPVRKAPFLERGRLGVEESLGRPHARASLMSPRDPRA